MVYIRRLAAAFFACVLAVLLPGVSLRAGADSSSIVAPTSVTRGSVVDVIVSISADEPIFLVSGNFSYDEILSYNSSNCVKEGGGGILSVSYSPSDISSTAVELSLTFTASSEGSCQLSFEGYAFNADGIVLAEPHLSTSVTVTERVGGQLTSLSPSVGELLPAFSPDIYDYAMKVDSDVDYVIFTASTLSDTDVISPEELKFWLSDGENIKRITVTDEAGGQKTYTIIIQREPSEPAEDDPSTADEPSSADDAASQAPDESAPADESVPESQSDEPAISQQDSTAEPAAVTDDTSVQDDHSPDYAEPDDGNTDDPASANTFSTGRDPSADPSEQSGVGELRSTLMPALLIALAVLLIALFIVIYWLRHRSEHRRKKIKSSNTAKKKK